MKKGRKFSEFEFIRQITPKWKGGNVIEGIGSDAAVVRIGNKKMALTTDMLAEGTHFSLNYFTARDIGVKAVECNVSDLTAVNAKPLYALVSLGLPKHTGFDFALKLSQAIHSQARKHGIQVIGGDTVRSDKVIVNIALIGEIQNKGKICLRSGAQVNDGIFVTGTLGNSMAGLRTFQSKLKGFHKVKQTHLQPKARMDICRQIAHIANAVEDVSDGLASEIRNICHASKKGALIFAEQIPIGKETQKVAEKLNERSLEYALNGGEDYELVYTVPEKYFNQAQKYGTWIGKIISGNKIYLQKNGEKIQLKKFGYDHFL